MENLSQIREEIDNIDKQLLDLFMKRMDLSKRVADVKLVTGDNIYKPEREIEVIKVLTDKANEKYGDKDKSSFIAPYFINIMNLSRQLQYSIVAGEKADQYGDNLVRKSDKQSVDTVFYQGLQGAYSHIASTNIFTSKDGNKPILISKNRFKDVFTAVKMSENSVGVIPLQNSTAGFVDEVYDLLLEQNLYITSMYELEINHCLCSVQGASLATIKTIFSHEQALSQCKNFINDGGYDIVPQSNTARSAKNVAQMNDITAGVICSSEAARINNLVVLKEGIANVSQNCTKFIVISNKLEIDTDDSKIRLVFKTEDNTGALSSVLSIFSSYSINLSHIYSRPCTDDLWSFSFYLEFDGNLLDKKIQTLLYQLKQELKLVKVLGSY